MVALRSFVAAGDTTSGALSELAKSIEVGKPVKPDFVSVFYDCQHDDQAIFEFVRAHFGDAALIGGTSCAGVMSEQGLGGPRSIGILIVEDPEGDYGTAAVSLLGNAADCAEQALHAALEDADCAGELPELIWIYQAPGFEEEVIEGLRRVVGDRCPIMGGTSADNDVAGEWRQLGPEGALEDGLVVGVLFSSGGIGVAFQGGYEPSGESGAVTKSRGREIISIDNEPASEVYNRWIGGILSDKLITGGNILTDTTMYPVGVDAGQIKGITHYMVIHPDKILENGSLTTFATVEEGTRLFSMRGNKVRLVERAGKVASAAVAMLPGGASGLAGGLVVYCGGCMLAVGDEMPNVPVAVSESFNSKPFLGCFTFGEQGAMLSKNAHGNLMISAIVFGK